MPDKLAEPFAKGGATLISTTDFTVSTTASYDLALLLLALVGLVGLRTIRRRV